MYQKILVPLDGSELAECALEHVKTVVKGCNVPEVVLLNVEAPIFTYWDYGAYPTADIINRIEEAYETWAKGYLDKVSKDLEEEGISARGVLLSGSAAEKILEYAEGNNVDLIIMATHGRSGPARWALGSVADRVVRLSKVPVMVVSPLDTGKRANNVKKI